MEKNPDTGMILAMLGKLSNDIQMNKAMLYTILKLISKEQNIDFESVLKKMESLHAQYVLKDLENYEELARKVLDEI